LRYLLRTTLGFALIACCWVVLGYAVYQLLQIGTCASGGPYEVARQCPDGTARVGLMIPAGVIGLLIGAWIYSGRGTAPGSIRGPRNGLLVVWVWTGIFWSIAAACFLGVWGPEANPGPGGKLGGLIVGFLFVAMGAGGLLALGSLRGAGRDPQTVRPAAARIAQTASRFGGAPAVDRLDTLDRLRKQGSLTDAEFETLKAQIIGGK
jgi:hypothetical protein